MANNNLLIEANKLGINQGSELNVSNVLDGGQLGIGFDARHLDSATPLTFTPTVLVVMQTPTMYDEVPNFGKMLKSLIETHAKTVSGIDFGYTLETEEGAVGHDGQPFAVPTKSQRTPVTPSFTFDELTGNLVWRLFTTWVRDISDPDTNAARNYMAKGSGENAFLMSSYAMSMMAIQFDQTMRPENIIDAAFYTNMFPTDPGGQLGLERQNAQTKTVERTVEMTGIVQHNDSIRDIAIEIAGKIRPGDAGYSLDNSNVRDRSTTTQDVNKDLEESGLAKEAEEAVGSSE